MKEGAEIVEKLIDGTLDGKIKWMTGQTTCYTQVGITDKKYLVYKIGTSFHHGRYEKTLLIKMVKQTGGKGSLTYPVLTLYANRFRRIYDLEIFIREGL